MVIKVDEIIMRNWLSKETDQMALEELELLIYKLLTLYSSPSLMNSLRHVPSYTESTMIVY